jgi:transcriptional regulator with XRE-family HTH domain
MTKREIITGAVKRAVRKSGQSLYSICKATGLNEDALSRFMRGQTSMRLDLADKLAAYFGIECRQTRPGKPAKSERK